MFIHNSTTKHLITLRLGILAYLDPMSISGLVAESDEVVFEPLFFHRRGSFSHKPPYISIDNPTTKHPIALKLGSPAFLDPVSLSGLVAESDEVVFESSFFHRRGSFSHKPPHISICNLTTTRPIDLKLGIRVYLDLASISGLVAKSDEVVFEFSFF